MDKYERENIALQLEIGLSIMEEGEGVFVAYNTRYLGWSPTDEYKIRGRSTKNSKALNEFCYGYDGEHHELHLLHIYETERGLRYAATELSMCVYAFWEILD